MIVVLFCVSGVAIGGALSIVWWSVDVLLGTHTISVSKGMALIGLSTVATACLAGALVLIGEWHGSKFGGHSGGRGPMPKRPPLPPSRND